MFYDRETKLFGEKVDPVTKHKIKPIQCFILFHELVFPSQLISDYLGEFNKMQGFMRDQSEEQKVILSLLYILFANLLLAVLQSQTSHEKFPLEHRGHKEFSKAYQRRKNVNGRRLDEIF